jgi:hypothetical protein
MTYDEIVEWLANVILWAEAGIKYNGENRRFFPVRHSYTDDVITRSCAKQACQHDEAYLFATHDDGAKVLALMCPESKCKRVSFRLASESMIKICEKHNNIIPDHRNKYCYTCRPAKRS